MPRATRLVDVCLDHGLTMFDSADIYSGGDSEAVLGAAIKGRRDKVLISTKATFRAGEGPNEVGSSRFHLTRAVESSLKRLGTDHIDLFQLHGYDAMTPPEEVLSTLDTLIRAGKIGYIGVSNFSGWHLMKALAVADRYGLPRYVANQTYYSLVGRDYEWELLPLGLDQGLGAVVWSPLGWGRLTGKIRRGQPKPEVSRLHKTAEMGPPVRVLQGGRCARHRREGGRQDRAAGGAELAAAASDVSTVVIGARNEQQLKDNLGAIGWNLTAEQVKTLDHASATTPAYPYWHQKQFKERNPFRRGSDRHGGAVQPRRRLSIYISHSFHRL